jgi:radical SAM protein with 4Fe4S-binding SPASM domain
MRCISEDLDLNGNKMFQDLEHIKKSVEKNEKFLRERGLNPNTFCVVPFTTIILEPNGSVGICRHKGSKFSMGNIKDNTISEIWNNEKVRGWRREFLEGKVKVCEVEVKHRQCNQCTQNNTILPFADFSEFQTGPILKLTANFNGKCNLRCQMCDIWALPNGLYGETNFWEPARKDIFPHLKEIDMLSGEPLIQADTFKLIDEVSEINPECQWTITTNIHWKFSKKIEDAFNKIKIKTLIISIDSLNPAAYAKIRKPGNLSMVLGTLDYILAYRKRVKDFNIRVNFLIQKDNWQEVFHILDFCYKKEVNPFLTFLYEPREFSLLDEPLEERKKILEFYFEKLTILEAVHLKKILLPLIESMPGIDRAFYLMKLHKLLVCAEESDGHEVTV